ncbi:hypothetical protein D3C80_1073620 [compost metagenome]
MTRLHENLSRAIYPILCDLAVKAGQAGPMTPAKASQMAARANSEAVKAAVEEIKRMARVDEGRAHG